MLNLSEEDVINGLSMPKAIELVEESFRQLAEGTGLNHPRRRLVMPGGSILHYMAGATPAYFGSKIYSTNARTGAHFQLLLYRAADGLPLATIEANHLGQIRTGAASGVATKHLARADAHVLGVIGSGFQAETQVLAMSLVRELGEVRVWSRSAAKRDEFAKRCREGFGLNARATDTAREAVEAADIVVTATSSREPVLEAAWISPGTHINAMGSNWANRRELPSQLVIGEADLVAVDSIEDARIESGDLIIAQRELQDPRFPGVELGDVIVGRTPGRTAPGQITIFKSNGLAIQDVAVAGFLYELKSHA